MGIYKLTGDVDAATSAHSENHGEPRVSEAGYPSLIYIEHVVRGLSSGKEVRICDQKLRECGILEQKQAFVRLSPSVLPLSPILELEKPFQTTQSLSQKLSLFPS